MVDDVSEVVQGDGDNSCVLLSVSKMEGMFIIYIYIIHAKSHIITYKYINIKNWDYFVETVY